MDPRLFERAKTTLAWAFQHPRAHLYQRLYRRASYNPLTHLHIPRDWLSVPFLEPRHLEQASWQDLLFLPLTEGVYITFSSGTTRRNHVAVFRRQDPEEACWPWLKIPRASALRAVLIIIPFPTFKYHDFAIRQGLVPVIGDVQNLAASALRALTFQADALQTIPTLALNAAAHFRSHYDPSRFRVVSVVGEKLTATKKALLTQHYPNAAIYADYSTAESGTIGYQCPILAGAPDGSRYHLWTSRILAEVLDPESHKPLPHGQPGELIVTTLTAVPTPLIRYRVADLVSVEEAPCACGDQNPVFTVIGRAGFDRVRAAGFELRLESFEEALRALADVLSFQFQVLVREVVADAAMKLRLVWQVVPLKKPLSPELAMFIKITLSDTAQLSPRYTISQAVAAGLAAPLEVEFVNEFPPSHKSPGMVLVED